MWQFLRGVAPDGCIAAREHGELVGYAIFIPSLKDVQRRAILSGAVLRWSWNALRRRELRPSAVGHLLRNKMVFISSGQRFRTTGDAQLLNIAVGPCAQGRGIARRLITRGLAQMRARGVGEVRLEVRPWNAAAIALYRRTGWREAGRTRDLEGEWVVMVADRF